MVHVYFSGRRTLVSIMISQAGLLVWLEKCWLSKISLNPYRVIAWASVLSVKMSLKILFPQALPLLTPHSQASAQGQQYPWLGSRSCCLAQGDNRSEGGESGGREIAHPKIP